MVIIHIINIIISILSCLGCIFFTYLFNLENHIVLVIAGIFGFMVSCSALIMNIKEFIKDIKR